MPSRMIHLGFTWATYCVTTNQASACCTRDEDWLDRSPTRPRTRRARRGASAELADSMRCGYWASGTHSASVCQGMSSSQDRAHSPRAAGDPASGCIDSRGSCGPSSQCGEEEPSPAPAWSRRLASLPWRRKDPVISALSLPLGLLHASGTSTEAGGRAPYQS